MLGTFQQTVAFVAVVILIVVLIIIAIMLAVQVNNQTWPPYSSTCPDYWDISGNKCINMHTTVIGNSDISGCKQFSLKAFSGDDSGCHKYNYATNYCNLTWDGITNNHHLHKTCDKNGST